jgi:hypothetical protein
MDIRGTVVCANPSCRVRVKTDITPAAEADRRMMRAECPVCGTVRSRKDVHWTDVVSVLYAWSVLPRAAETAPAPEASEPTSTL